MKREVKSEKAIRPVLSSTGRNELSAYLTTRLPLITYVELLRWEKGRSVASHVHGEEWQFDYFPEGKGRYQVGVKPVEISREMFFSVPPGARHSIRSSCDSPLLGISVKCTLPGMHHSLLPTVATVPTGALPSLEGIMRGVVSEHVLNREERQLVARLRMAELLVHLTTCLQPDLGRRSGGISETLRTILHQRFREPLTLRNLADAVQVSPPHLCRIVRQETGETPFDILRRIRVEQARQLLGGGRMTVAEASRQAGFSSLQQMKRAFQQVTGMTSREYRHQSIVFNETHPRSEFSTRLGNQGP